jgi:hypothetical protein
MLFLAFSLIVVVDDFDFMGSILLLYETDSILLIDSDAMPARPASGHLLEQISRRLFQVVQLNCHPNHVQLAKGHARYAVPSPILPELRQLRRIVVFKAYDHLLIICCDASNAMQLR